MPPLQPLAERLELRHVGLPVLHLTLGAGAHGHAADLRVAAAALPLLVSQPFELVGKPAPEGAQGRAHTPDIVPLVVAPAGQRLLVVGHERRVLLLGEAADALPLELGGVAQVAADLQYRPFVRRRAAAQRLIGQAFDRLVDQVGDPSQVGGDLGAVHGAIIAANGLPVPAHGEPVEPWAPALARPSTRSRPGESPFATGGAGAWRP